MFGPFDFFIVFFFIPAVIMYFVPTIVAIIRRARNLAGIILINLFLGWTFFGWVGALVWAVVDQKQTPQPRRYTLTTGER